MGRCGHRVSVGIASLFVVVVVVTRLRVLTFEEVCGRVGGGLREVCEERGVSRGVRCESRGGEWRQRVPEEGVVQCCSLASNKESLIQVWRVRCCIRRWAEEGCDESARRCCYQGAVFGEGNDESAGVGGKEAAGMVVWRWRWCLGWEALLLLSLLGR